MTPAIKVIIFVLALTPPGLQARESVCLKSGFCLEADSHMISDGMLILQRGKGTLQFPVDQVEQILALPVVSEPTVEPKLVSVPAKAVNQSEELLIKAAIQQGLEPDFVRSVAMVESGLRQDSLSPKGAMGLMQLMPLTAGQLGVNPNVAEQNALGGATFLRQLLLKYNGDSSLALAAYNAGSGAVDRYRGVPPYMETRQYIVRVLQEYAKQRRLKTEKNLQVTKPAPGGHEANTAIAEAHTPTADSNRALAGARQ